MLGDPLLYKENLIGLCIEPNDDNVTYINLEKYRPFIEYNNEIVHEQKQMQKPKY